MTFGILILLQAVGLEGLILLPLCLTAFALGVAGIIQQRRKRLFAVLGTILSGLMLAGVLLLIVWAILAS